MCRHVSDFRHQRGAQMWDFGVRFGWCEGGSVEGFLFHIGNNMTPFTRARMAFRPYRHMFINGGANDAMLRSAWVPFHGRPSLRVLFVDPVPTFRLDPSFLTGVQKRQQSVCHDGTAHSTTSGHAHGLQTCQMRHRRIATHWTQIIQHFPMSSSLPRWTEVATAFAHPTEQSCTTVFVSQQ